MKKQIPFIFFTLIVLNVLSQENHIFQSIIDYDTLNPSESSTSNDIPKKESIGIVNIKVSRNPVEILVSQDDKYAFVRCFLSNSIDVIELPIGEKVNSLKIPCPNKFIFNNDSSQIYVTSFTDYMFPNDIPADDCDLIGVESSGFTYLTTIDISTQSITRIDSIPVSYIRKILVSSIDSLVYFEGKNITQYNLNKREITKKWEINQQIRKSIMDKKNNRIFITTTSSIDNDSLNIVDIYNDTIYKVAYYKNEEDAHARFIGLDTASNRVFINGKSNPSEVLVFDTRTLTKTNTIQNVNLTNECFVLCPQLESIFIEGDRLSGIKELDYNTLEIKNELPASETKLLKTLFYNKKENKLFSFMNGGYENSLDLIPPNQKLDLVEYNLNTNQTSFYETTEFEYDCSYQRDIAFTQNGNFLLITNSPENTVSLIDLNPNSTSELGFESTIDISPNPTSSVINIQMNEEFSSNYYILIYNIYGEVIHQELKSGYETYFSIDLSSFSNGQYFVHFKSNEQTKVFKILKM